MRSRTVRYSQDAEDDLDSIYGYVADEASVSTALAFVERIDAFCLSLSHASERGTHHHEIRAGLRSVGFERRVTIFFQVSEDSVSILRVFYAGRDWQASLDEFGG